MLYWHRLFCGHDRASELASIPTDTLGEKALMADLQDNISAA
jgi:hypothetical protein